MLLVGIGLTDASIWGYNRLVLRGREFLSLDLIPAFEEICLTIKLPAERSLDIGLLMVSSNLSVESWAWVGWVSAYDVMLLHWEYGETLGFDEHDLKLRMELCSLLKAVWEFITHVFIDITEAEIVAFSEEAGTVDLFLKFEVEGTSGIKI